MSLKAELHKWAEALNAYDDGNLEEALSSFSTMTSSSRISTNIGLIHSALGDHEAAIEQFENAIALDQYLAITHFQCGVSNFLLGRYESALTKFKETRLYLRANQSINYEQLGLKFTLVAAEVIFNQGLSQILMGYLQEGLADMEQARKLQVINDIDHSSIIDDAIQDRGEGYTVFSIPTGLLFRPSEVKLKSTVKKDFIGSAVS